MKRFFKSLLVDGVEETSFRVLHRLRMLSCLHTFEMFFYVLDDADDLNLSEGSARPLKNGIRLVCGEIKEEALGSLNRAPGLYSVEVLQEHFERGMRFFGASHGDLLVGIHGFHPRSAQLTYIGWPLVHLPDNAAYLNCAFTAAAYRNLGVGSRLRSFVLSTLKKEGFHLAVAAVFIEKKGVMAWHSKQRFKRWGRISYMKRGAHEFWRKKLTVAGREHKTLFDLRSDVPEMKVLQEAAL